MSQMDDDGVVLKPKKKQEEEGESERITIKPKKKMEGAGPVLRPEKKVAEKAKPPPKAEETEIKKRKEVITFTELLAALGDVNISVLRKGRERVFDRSKKIRPGFSPSWVSPHPPIGAKAVTGYEIDGSKVTLFQLPEEIESSYHVRPLEYELPLDQIRLIHLARGHLTDRYPKNIQIDNPQQAREYILRLGNKLIYQLAKKHGIRLGSNRTEEMHNVKKLAEALAKYTAGLGVLEFFLNTLLNFAIILLRNNCNFSKPVLNP